MTDTNDGGPTPQQLDRLINGGVGVVFTGGATDGNVRTVRTLAEGLERSRRQRAQLEAAVAQLATSLDRVLTSIHSSHEAFAPAVRALNNPLVRQVLRTHHTATTFPQERD